MTTSTLTPPSEALVLPLPSDVPEAKDSQPAVTPQRENSAIRDDLQDTVRSVVDEVVKDAVFEASVLDEKKSVQRLITDLVTRVRDEASASTQGLNSAPSSSRSHIGVPPGDQRPRRLSRDSPVTWCQTADYVTMNVIVPAWVRKQHVDIAFSPGAVEVKVAQNADTAVQKVVGGPLVAQIDVDGCIWSLEGSGTSRTLTIELEKGREQWWARLLMSDDPKDYCVIEPPVKPASSTKSQQYPIPSKSSTGPTDPTTANGKYANTDDAIKPGPVAQDPSHASVDAEEPHAIQDESRNSTSDLQSTVEAVVGELVTNAVESLSMKQNYSQAAGAAASSSRGKEQNEQNRKVLTKADLSHMVDQYKDAFKKGGPAASEAALQLATFYHHGIGVDQNDAQAARLYKFALENGTLDASAAFQLGLIFNQGADGLEPDPAEAVRWWQVSARLGNSVAMFNLGVMTMNGSGCDMDPVSAIRWFRQAQMLNPQLRPPQFSAGQLEERMAMAAKIKKERMKQALPPEEKLRRREEALNKARMFAYGTGAVVGIGVSALIIRHWLRNRL